MAQAEIHVDILEDGTIRWKTGKIPAEHHDDADALQAEMETLMGGKVERTSTGVKPRHTHHHDHIHEHTHQ